MTQSDVTSADEKTFKVLSCNVTTSAQLFFAKFGIVTKIELDVNNIRFMLNA